MKIIRYGFPILAGIFMGALFTIPDNYVKASLFGFAFWGIMEVAGRLNDN